MSNESATKLVPIRVFSGVTAAFNAELARNVLAEEGIDSMVAGETAVEVIPLGQEVPLLVREEDAQRAGEVLVGYFETPADVAGSEE
jgi:hypothetical protein